MALVLVVGWLMLPLNTVPSHAVSYKHFKFTYGDFDFQNLYDNYKVKVIKYNGQSATVNIPKEFEFDGDTYYVTEIGDKCFFDNDYVKNVRIPNSVIKIGYKAFNNCVFLNGVSIPDSVESIDSYAFAECISLEKIEFQDGLKSLGSYAFQNCKEIKELKLPDGLQTIGKRCFSHCEKVTSISIPNSITEIGSFAFEYCIKVEKVTLPNGIETIPDHCFYMCGNLNDVQLPDSVKYIEDGAFDFCNFSSFNIPNSVKKIGDFAIGDNWNLTSLFIPESVEEFKQIGALHELTSIYVPLWCKRDFDEKELLKASKTDHVTYYSTFTVNASHGKVSFTVTDTPSELLIKKIFLVDDAVVVNATPDNGYKLSSIEVLNDNNKAITLTDNMFFVNSSKYTINVKFESIQNGNASGSNGTKYSSEWRNGKWYNSDGSQTYKATMSWKSNSTGWWIEDSMGWYPKEQWMKIDGYWYYFKSDGYMASNEWIDGYWLSDSGALTYDPVASWYSDSYGWYFMDSSGWYPYSQWQKINGSWYYFDGSGYMVTSTYIDGYWIDSNGVCQ